MDKADVEPTTAPHDRAPALNRQQRQKVIRQKRRLVEEAKEAQQRPGSNVPPVSDDAKIAANRHRSREAIAEILDSAQITNPGERLLWQQLIEAERSYREGGNPAAVALWQLTALLRFHEPPPGSRLLDLDALQSLRILRNAIEDAVDGKLATFQALLPKREAPKGGAAPLTTVAYRRTYVAAGLEVLTRQGGFTRTVAKKKVRDEFGKNGISVTEGSVLEYYKRRKHDADMFAVFEKMTAHVPRSRPEREARLKQLAESAGRILETET